MNVLPDNAQYNDNKKEKNMVLIKPPKPFWNLEVQSIVAISSIPIIAVSILGYIDIGNVSILVFAVIILLIIFAMLYVITHVNNVVISEGKKLQIYKKGIIIKEYSLSDIKKIIGRYTKLSLEFPKYEVILVKNTEESFALLDVRFFFSKKQWDSFSEKLSIVAKKPFERECLLEDYDGKIALASYSEMATNKRRGILYSVLYLCVPFIAALGFKLFPTIKSFIFLGILSVLVNIVICIFYGFINEVEIKKTFGGCTIFIFFVLRSIVPNLLAYVFFIFILMGSDALKIFHWE